MTDREGELHGGPGDGVRIRFDGALPLPPYVELGTFTDHVSTGYHLYRPRLVMPDRSGVMRFAYVESYTIPRFSSPSAVPASWRAMSPEPPAG